MIGTLGAPNSAARLVAGAYVLGVFNTNSCPAGSSVITAAAQCQAAATALGLRYGGSAASNSWPRGCARSASTNTVEFNSHVSGAADPDYTPICAAAGTRGCRYAVLFIWPHRPEARTCFGMTGSVSSRVSGDCRLELDGPHEL
jgi:hypothetical protein